MVPAAIVILVCVAVGVVLWAEDRRELRRVKRDVKRLLDRLERIERLLASAPTPD